MADIALTVRDLDDLRDHHTINAAATDSSEHILGPRNLDADDLKVLARGGSIDMDVDGIDCHITAEAHRNPLADPEEN